MAAHSFANRLRLGLRSTPRTRRLATSGAFAATFAASILTVSLSASTWLPCPANRSSGSRGALAENGNDGEGDEGGRSEPQRGAGVGQRVLLTKKGGWIEIEEKRPRRRTEQGTAEAAAAQ